MGCTSPKKVWRIIIYCIWESQTPTTGFIFSQQVFSSLKNMRWMADALGHLLNVDVASLRDSERALFVNGKCILGRYSKIITKTISFSKVEKSGTKHLSQKSRIFSTHQRVSFVHSPRIFGRWAKSWVPQHFIGLEFPMDPLRTFSGCSNAILQGCFQAIVGKW